MNLFFHMKVQVKVHLELHLEVKKIQFYHFQFFHPARARAPRAYHLSVVIPIENVAPIGSALRLDQRNSVCHLEVPTDDLHVNLHVNLNMKKKVHLKLHMNLYMKVIVI